MLHLKKAFAIGLCFALLFSIALAERVTFPDALTEIKAGAFANDTSITEVVFGENLTSIGNDAFENCKNLKEAWAYNIEPITIGSGALNGVAPGFLVHTIALGKMGACGTMSASEIINEGAIPVMPRYRALIVGETYKGTSDFLPGCDEDANSMLQVLDALNLTEYDTSPSNKPINATKSEILNKLNELARESKGMDVTLFYFSGHGSGDGTLVVMSDENEDEEGGGLDIIQSYELRNALHAISGKKIVIVDACYSGGLINRKQTEENGIKSFTEGFLSAFISDMQERSTGDLADENGEYQVLVSCSQNELSNSMILESGGAFGLFTRYLQEAIGLNRLEWTMPDRINITDEMPGDTNHNSFLTLNEAYHYIDINAENFIKEWNKLHPKEEDKIEQHVKVWPDNSSFVLFGRCTEN